MRNMVEDHERPWLTQLRRGVAEHCVLALLRAEPGYGFDLAQILARQGLVSGEGTIYPLLARLRRAQWVETFWKESSEGPPRRYYRLTPLGEAVLTQFADEWGRFRDAVDQVLEGAWHDA